jgi:hypothetical protein
MVLYRAVPKLGFRPGEKIRRFPGRRLPGNIPYFVDNLWEFARPEGAPSRRHAVYASPTPVLALKNASAFNVPPDGYVACRVEFHTEPAMMQLGVTDARAHHDVGHLQKLLNQRMAGVAAHGLADKQPLAALFLPGVTSAELRAAMAASTLLNDLVTEAAAAVRLWADAPVPEGELFFEIGEDNYYLLHPL